MMRLKEPDKLTPEEKMATMNCETAYRLSYDCNDLEAAKHFKELPWLKTLITPTRIFFRN